MPGNADPIYTRAGSLGSPVAITTGNSSSQGGGTIGTDIFLAFTADATNGSFVREVRLNLGESSIGTPSTATVGRVFLSTQTSGSTTSSNTHLWMEVSLPAQTPTATVAGVAVVIPMNLILPAGWTILVTTGASPAANTHWKATVVGGNY